MRFFEKPLTQLAPRIMISGAPRSGKRRLALGIARMAGLEPVIVSMARLYSADWGKRLRRFDAMMEEAARKPRVVILPDADLMSAIIAASHLDKFGRSWFIATSDTDREAGWGAHEGWGYGERNPGKLWLRPGLFTLHLETPVPSEAMENLRTYTSLLKENR